jgi:large subunit ribosomal protein L4
VKAPLYSQDGKQTGEVDLPKDLFSATEVSEHLIHLALVRQHANARISSAHTLRRGEVKGTTAKLFRQKGTGRARVGDRRSPIRRGGGVAWGPRNDRNFTQQLPLKARRKALAGMLTNKQAAKKVAVLEKFELDTPKTKEYLKLKAGLPENRSVLVVHNRNDILARSARNVEYTKALVVNYLNPHDLLKYDLILFEKSALEEAANIFKLESKKATK